ncbi:MAG: pantetheine-phosphate adenylyltransferase [Candidatus Planktophila sp.]
MKRAVCPGSFDPITFGHLDIIERASKQFDEVHVTVFVNRKKDGLFSIQERLDLIAANVAQFKNVIVESGEGLLVDYCKEKSVDVIVKGLRAVTDFDYELQMAQVHTQASGVETMFMATSPTHSFLSSSIVKELAYYGGDVSSMVPANVNAALQARAVSRAGK